jgi:hypothetical protein
MRIDALVGSAQKMTEILRTADICRPLQANHLSGQPSVGCALTNEVAMACLD